MGADLETSFSSSALNCDDPLICPGNSNLIALLGPYEIDETGQKFSPRGFRMRALSKPESNIDWFHVEGAMVVAHTADGKYLTGDDVVGLTIDLEHVSGAQFTLHVEERRPGFVETYSGGVSHIEAWHVLYTIPGAPEPKPLCPYTDKVDENVTGDWLVFWKGDRYDPDTGKIFASDAEVGSWVNLSCAGEATIKMLRAGAGGAVADSPVAQRQATLNMFTASYCGPGGGRYTQLGQQITWKDLSGPNEMVPISSYEAIWSETGAVCLDVPRMVDRREIQCQIPTCSSSEIANWPSIGWLLSGNPLP